MSKRNISITGLGYIGPCQAVAFANAGFEVWGLDIKPDIVEKLAAGEPTIEEEGLATLLRRNKDRLHFTTDLEEATKNTSVHYICVGTPMKKDGSGEADIQYVLAAAKEKAEMIKSFGERERPDLIILKSTVKPGTNELVDEICREAGLTNYQIISNPEFGAEGTMVHDFNKPHKIIIGADETREQYHYAIKTMKKVNRPFVSEKKSGKLLITDPITAELAKYFCNGQLLANIAFAMDGAALCDVLGADWEVVRKSMVLDKRIGGSFHYPGPKAGGMCFPKDSNALAEIGRSNRVTMYVMEGAIQRNELHARVCAEKVVDMFQGNLEGRTVGLWGLSFKPETDDCRYTAALDICDYLLVDTGTKKIIAYDPIPGARENFKKEIQQTSLKDRLELVIVDSIEATFDSDALMLLTESREYKGFEYERLLPEHTRAFVDTRNALSEDQIQVLRSKGISYTGNGRYGKKKKE